MRYFLLVALVVTAWSWGLNIGAKPSDFELKATDGKSYSLLKSLSTDTGAVVVFIATKCPYSNAYNERYNALAAELKAKNFAFLAINSNDTEDMDEVTRHAKSESAKFSFPVLKDVGHKVADIFNAQKTPEAFVIAKSGEIVYHGRIDDDSEGRAVKRRDLLAAVEESLAGKTVSVKEMSAFGCSIKRK